MRTRIPYTASRYIISRVNAHDALQTAAVYVHNVAPGDRTAILVHYRDCSRGELRPRVP